MEIVTVRWDPWTIRISGQIEDRDYTKCIAYISDHSAATPTNLGEPVMTPDGTVLVLLPPNFHTDDYFPWTVILENSPGGNVAEAMKIGKAVREGFARTMVDGNCNSACFLISVAGIKRGAIGVTTSVASLIHRPYFDPKMFGALPFDCATERYRSLLSEVRAYLHRMDVSETVVQEMYSAGPDEHVNLTVDEYNDRITRNAPTYYEWLKAKCDTLTTKEENDVYNVLSLESAIENSTTTAQREAYFFDYRKYPEGYRAYSKKKFREEGECERSILDPLRRPFIESW